MYMCVCGMHMSYDIACIHVWYTHTVHVVKSNHLDARSIVHLCSNPNPLSLSQSIREHVYDHFAESI